MAVAVVVVVGRPPRAGRTELTAAIDVVVVVLVSSRSLKRLSTGVRASPIVHPCGIGREVFLAIVNPSVKAKHPASAESTSALTEPSSMARTACAFFGQCLAMWPVSPQSWHFLSLSSRRGLVHSPAWTVLQLGHLFPPGRSGRVAEALRGSRRCVCPPFAPFFGLG